MTDKQTAQPWEPPEYQPPVPKRTFQMVVYVRMRGRGRPMPYTLDEEDE